LLIPQAWCGREAKAWFNGDSHLQSALARGVEAWVTRELSSGDFQTGKSLYNGEWLMGTYLMAGLGFGQAALSHPQEKEHYHKLMKLCIERILTPGAREYDRAAWGEDPLENLESPLHHLAYLGYMNVVLSHERTFDSSSPYGELNDRITAKLARAYEKEPSLLLYTYPGQKYLPDNCAAMASIALHDRATGSSHRALIRRWLEKCRASYCDPRTGLLYQTDRPPGRGSGTAMGVYFLSFVDHSLSAHLYEALKKWLAEAPMGFGAVREYPHLPGAGQGDIDSGPVILGWGFSTTGFSIAGSRIHGDFPYFEKLCRTAYLAGAPVDRNGTRNYVMGGPLGNAILFAMLTARREDGGKGEKRR
jgi:hypothetical protein